MSDALAGKEALAGAGGFGEGAPSFTTLPLREVAGREKLLLPRLPGPPFTYAALKAIHRELFQDACDWAGHQRTGTLGKPIHDAPSSPLCLGYDDPGRH